MSAMHIYIRLCSLVLILLFLFGCAKNYTVSEELHEQLVPGVCRIGAIEYDSAVVSVGPGPLSREPIHLLRQQLEFALEGANLFSEVTLYEDSEDYVVRGVIKEFRDRSGHLNFPGLSRSGTVQATVHLELQDTTGAVLFAGDFSRRVTSRYGVNELVYERIAHAFARAIREQMGLEARAEDSVAR